MPTTLLLRAVGRSENPGVPVLIWCANLPLLAEIGFIAFPKSWGTMVPLVPPGTTGLLLAPISESDLPPTLLDRCNLPATQRSHWSYNDMYYVVVNPECDILMKNRFST